MLFWHLLLKSISMMIWKLNLILYLITLSLYQNLKNNFMNLFSCVDPIYSTQNPSVISCNEWIVVASDQLQNEITQPNPENLMLAFGTGLVVMLPLYVALWGVRRARDALKQS